MNKNLKDELEGYLIKLLVKEGYLSIESVLKMLDKNFILKKKD